MKILFPQISPETTSGMLSDLVTRFIPRKSPTTTVPGSPISAARVVKIEDPKGDTEFFGLVELVSEDDGRLFLAIANELSKRGNFTVAREFKGRGPDNPLFPPEVDRRRPNLKLEVVIDADHERADVA